MPKIDPTAGRKRKSAPKKVTVYCVHDSVEGEEHHFLGEEEAIDYAGSVTDGSVYRFKISYPISRETLINILNYEGYQEDRVEICAIVGGELIY